MLLRWKAATRPDLYPPLDPLLLATASDISLVLIPNPTRPQPINVPQPPALLQPTCPPPPLPTSASKRLRSEAFVSDPTNPDPHAALSNRIHIIFLGTEGYLYRPIDLILTSNLQIPPSPDQSATCCITSSCPILSSYPHSASSCP